MYVLLSCILLVCLAGPAWGVQRFLSCPGGSDAAAGTSAGTAWLTIGKYLSDAAAGDSLVINRGSSCAVTTTSNRLQLKGSVGAYGAGADPIIDCSAMTTNNNGGCVHAGTASSALSGITIEEIEVTGGRLRGIFLENCVGCIVRNVTVHNITGDTGFGILTFAASVNLLLEGFHVYNIFESAGSEVAGAIRIGSANAIIQDGYVHDTDRVGISITNPATGGVVRRNTVLGHSIDDPMIYYTGGGSVEFDSNVAILYVDTINTTSKPMSLNVEPLGAVGTRFIRNSFVHNNILGYATARGFTMNVLSTVATDGPGAQLQHNNVVNNNTWIKIKCCGSTYGDATALQMDDLRTPGDGTDWSSNVLRDNLFWEAGPEENVQLRDGIALATCSHNFFQTGATFSGASNCTPTANNNTSTSTNPFVSFSATPDTPINNPQNFNLTATTSAFNSGTDGRSRGALQPVEILSGSVQTATPNTAQLTLSTYPPLEVCTASLLTVTVAGSPRTPTTSCTPSGTVIFPGAAVTAGQSVVIDAAQGAFKGSTIGCGTAACQGMVISNCPSCLGEGATVEHETFWRHENFPYTNFVITNNVDGPGETTVRTQTAARCHEIRILPTAASTEWQAPENAECAVVSCCGVIGVLQMQVSVADMPAVGIRLDCRENEGSYYQVQSTFGANKIAFQATSTFSDQMPIAARLLSDPGGAFIPGNFHSSTAVSTVAVANGAFKEEAFSLRVSGTAVSGDLIECRLVLSDGTLLTYDANKLLKLRVFDARGSGL